MADSFVPDSFEEEGGPAQGRLDRRGGFAPPSSRTRQFTQSLADDYLRPVVGQAVQALVPPFMQPPENQPAAGSPFLRPTLGAAARGAQSMVPEKPATYGAIAGGARGGVLGATGGGMLGGLLEADPVQGALEGGAEGLGGYTIGKAGEKVAGGLAKLSQNALGQYVKRAFTALEHEVGKRFGSTRGQQVFKPSGKEGVRSMLGDQPGQDVAENLFTMNNSRIGRVLQGRFGTSEIDIPFNTYDNAVKIVKGRVTSVPQPGTLSTATTTRLPFEDAITLLKNVRELRAAALKNPSVLGNQVALAKNLEPEFEDAIVRGLASVNPQLAQIWRQNNAEYSAKEGLRSLYREAYPNNKLDWGALSRQLTDPDSLMEMRRRLGNDTVDRLRQKLNIGELGAGLYRPPTFGGVSAAPPTGGSPIRAFFGPGALRMIPGYPGFAPAAPPMGPAMATPPLEWLLRKKAEMESAQDTPQP